MGLPGIAFPLKAAWWRCLAEHRGRAGRPLDCVAAGQATMRPLLAHAGGH